MQRAMVGQSIAIGLALAGSGSSAQLVPLKYSDIALFASLTPSAMQSVTVAHETAVSSNAPSAGAWLVQPDPFQLSIAGPDDTPLTASTPTATHADPEAHETPSRLLASGGADSRENDAPFQPSANAS